MVELQHSTTIPPSLSAFLVSNPNPTPADFDSAAFTPVKWQVKAALHQDQGGLCVYCEQKLAANEGQVEHIKPKSGPNAHPHLAFDYFNYAHGCINNKTCGQKKKAGLLPIEPGPGCNAQFMLSTDGDIVPKLNLPRQTRHEAMQTLQMLGLTAQQSPALAADRKKLIDIINLLRKETPQTPAQFSTRLRLFLANEPFRHLMLHNFA